MKDIRYNDPLQLGACVLLSSQELLPAQLEQLYNPHHLSETKVSHGKRQLGLPIRYVALARVGSVKPCRGNNSNTVHASEPRVRHGPTETPLSRLEFVRQSRYWHRPLVWWQPQWQTWQDTLSQGGILQNRT